MTPERQRPAGWQAGQGAMSAACSGDSARQRSASDDSRKLVLQDAPLPRDVALRARAEAERLLAAIQRDLVGAPDFERRRVWWIVRTLRRAKAGALMALRDQPVARAPRAAARPAPRTRERRSKASPAARPVRTAAAVAVLDDGGGDGAGGDDDDGEPARGQEHAA